MGPSINPAKTQRYREQFNAKYGDNFRKYAKDNGYSDDEVNQYLQRQLPTFIQQRAMEDQATQPAPTVAASKPKGNVLTSLIPTAGGVGGALAGGAAGAAVGSVVPVVGTAVGGLIGAILGGGGGSALGKVGQNAAEGETDLSKGVLEEGLLGGVTSTPLGAGAKLANAGFRTISGIGRAGAGELVQDAGVKTLGRGTVNRLGASGRLDESAMGAVNRLGGGTAPVTQAIDGATPPVTSVAGRLKSAGDKALLAQYGTISKPFARSTDPADTIARLADAGLTKPTDVERVSSAVTGGGGLITNAIAKAVGKAGGVDTSTVRQVFNDALDNYGLVEKDRASLQKVFDAQMKKLAGGANGSLNPLADPTEVLATMRALEKRAANLVGKGDNYRLSTPERQDQASVLNLVRDELEDKLYTGAGANAKLTESLTPELRTQLLDLVPNNPQWQAYVENNIMGAKTVGELRSSMSPFVRGGKIIEEGEQNSITAGGRLGNAFSGNGILGAIGETVTNAVKPTAQRLTGNTLRKASGIVAGNGERAARPVGQGIAGLATRGVVGGAALDAFNEQPTDAMAMSQQPSDLNDVASLGMDQGQLDMPIDPNEDTNNPFGVSLNSVAVNMRSALANGDTKGYATLSDVYDRIAASYETQDTELSSDTKKSLGTSANAISTLDQLEGLFQQTGGGSGRLGGAIQGAFAGAGFDDNAAAYNSLAASATSQLAKAINGSGQVSDADAAALIKALPLLTDNPAVAAAKFRALRERLSVSQQNAAAFGGGSGGGDDLQSVLAAL